MDKEMKVRIIYLVLVVALFLVLVSPFIIPIFFASTMALTLTPLLHKLERMGMQKKRAAALLTVLFTVIISIPLFFFLYKGTIAVTGQLEKMQINQKLREQGVSEIVSDMRHDLVYSVQKFSKKYEFLSFLNEKKIDQYMGLANNYLLRFFQGLAASLPELFVLLLIMILCIYSFLKNGPNVYRFLKTVSGFSNERMEQLSLVFIRDSRQVYLSNIATGSVQSIMVATGVSLLGQGEFFLTFFVTLILSFVPVIGAAPVAILYAIVAFFKGDTTSAIILVVLGATTGVADNLMRPWLTTFGESKIPPIVAFICVIGGALLFGFPGLFIGLLIGSIAYDTLPIFWDEIGTKK